MSAVFVGEGMLELSRDGDAWQLGHGGDTLNTAIHLARAGIHTSYLSAVGNDPFSLDLRRRWVAEGLDDTLLLIHPTRGPGLYAISTDSQGERSFTYWRGESAARELFNCPGIEAALARASQARLLGFSLITLAILPVQDRQALLRLAHQVKSRGGLVAFDGNYRPRLWPSAAEACAWRDAALGVATIGFPTLDDERQLGSPDSADAVATQWKALGCIETVVKLGARGCRLPDGRLIAPVQRLKPVDTSGAGDAFNGGYLSARLSGALPVEAAHAGNALAGWCIMRRGALPPRD